MKGAVVADTARNLPEGKPGGTCVCIGVCVTGYRVSEAQGCPLTPNSAAEPQPDPKSQNQLKG